MKKHLIFTAAVIISLCAAGCSKGGGAPEPAQSAAATEAAAGNETAQASPSPAVSKYGENFEGADEDVDMDAIEGGETSVAEDSEASGDLADAEVSIDDARVADDNGDKVIVVSFSFRNTTAEGITFTGFVKTDASQDGAYLVPATTFSAEGYVPETIVQVVPPGEAITVQRAYRLINDESPVTITAENALESSESQTRLSKTFNIK